jgi:xylulokinase
VGTGAIDPGQGFISLGTSGVVFVVSDGFRPNPQRARAPLFLPYLSGERSPHNDPDAQGVLFGLTASHDAAAIAYAVVEGVSFGLLDGVSSFGAMVSNEPLSLVGGGARSGFWAQLLATVLDRTLVVHEGGEAGGALGAARLAWLADGGTVQAVCARPPEARRFESQAHQRALLLERHRRFTRLYPALIGQFHR